jgi:alpha/beta superfamily hydrolase
VANQNLRARHYPRLEKKEVTVERHIAFMSENLRIEGLLDCDGENRGAVITHPHPLYGGDMHNPVVESIQKTYRHNGYATLRFDFRGTGQSRGRYDEGRGERRDVQAAVACIAEHGIQWVDLVGYSFGAWINALAVRDGLTTQRLVMVSPPTAFIDFATIQSLPALNLVITGSLDDIAPPHQIQQRLQQWNPAAAFEVIPDCDHFYSGHLRQLQDLISRYLSE